MTTTLDEARKRAEQTLAGVRKKYNIPTPVAYGDRSEAAPIDPQWYVENQHNHTVEVPQARTGNVATDAVTGAVGGAVNLVDMGITALDFVNATARSAFENTNTQYNPNAIRDFIKPVIDPARTKEILENDFTSSDYKEAMAELQTINEDTSLGQMAKYGKAFGHALSNPNILAKTGSQSLVDMVAGGVYGKAFKAMGAGVKTASALGEGAVVGLNGLNEAYKEDGQITGKDVIASLVKGVATAGISRVLNSGATDIDNLFVGGGSQLQKAGSLAGRQVAAFGKEIAEEGFQEGVEQGIDNWQHDRPLDDMVAVSAGMGSAMGLGMHATLSVPNAVAHSTQVATQKAQNLNAYDYNKHGNVNHHKFDAVRTANEIYQELNNENTSSKRKDELYQQQANLSANMINKLAELNKQIEQETDETKKQKLSKEYENFKARADELDKHLTGLYPQEDNTQLVQDIIQRNAKLSQTGGITTTKTNAKSVGFDHTKPVAIMGDYSQKDTGKGSGDHYDLRLASVNGKRGDINPYLNRFSVNGKNLDTYKQTGTYLEQRKGYVHEGVDFGFRGSFGGNAQARKLYIAPEYKDKVAKISYFDNNNKGGGWVTQVTFTDGVKVNILHQNKTGVDEVMGYHGNVSQNQANNTQIRTAGNSSAGLKAVSVVSAGEGKPTVLQMNDGSVISMQGARNWRNFNSGNIEYGDFARKHGAIGSDGRFAIFPDNETGDKARQALIFESGNYKNLSLKQAIARYAPPSENNTDHYYNAILKAVGTDKTMNSYNQNERKLILDAMKKVEGYKEGNTTIVQQGSGIGQPDTQTNIDTLTQQLQELEQQEQNEQTQAQISELQAQIEALKQQPTTQENDTAEQVQADLSKVMARASSFSADSINALLQAGITNEEQTKELRRLLDVKAIIASNASTASVTQQQQHGLRGNSRLESNLGLNDYYKALESGIASNNQSTIDTYMGYLKRWNDNYTNKARALQEALALNPNTQNPVSIVPDRENNWTVQRVPANDELRKAGALQVNLDWKENANNLYNSILTEAKQVNDFYNSYKNRLDNGSTTTTQEPSVQTATDSSNVTNSRFDVSPVNNQTKQSSSKPTTKQYDSIRAVSLAQVSDYVRADNEVWVGKGYTKQDNGKHRPNKSMSNLTDTTLATGEHSHGSLFNADGLFDVGGLGNPFNKNHQGAWGAKDRADEILKYTDYVKNFANTTDPKRTRFLEDLMQLRGMQLATSQYEVQEAQFLDYIVNKMPQELADSLLNIDPMLSNKERLAQTKQAREWVEGIVPKITPHDDGTASIKFDTDTRAIDEQVKARKVRMPDNTKQAKQQNKGQSNDTNSVSNEVDRYSQEIDNLPDNTLSANEIADMDKVAYEQDKPSQDTINQSQKESKPRADTKPVQASTSGNGLQSKHAKKQIQQAPEPIKERVVETMQVDLSSATNLYDAVKSLVDTSKHKYKEVLGSIIEVLGTKLDKPSIQYSKDFDIDDNKIYIKKLKDPLEKLAQLLIIESLTDLSNDLSNANEHAVSLAKYQYEQTKSDEDKEDYEYLQKFYDIKAKLQKANTAIINADNEKLQNHKRYNEIISKPELLLTSGLTDKTWIKELQSIKVKANRKYKTTVYRYLLDTVKDFFGFGTDELSVFELLVSALGDITQDSFNHLAADETAKLSALQVTNEYRQEQLQLKRGERNEFVVAFNQGRSTALSKFKDFGLALNHDTNRAITSVLKRGIDAHEQGSIDDFLEFKAQFTQHLLASFEKTKGYEHKDLKAYLYDETTGQIDDNVLTALSYSAYNWLAVNGGKQLTTYDDVKYFLGVDKDSDGTIPRAVYEQYEDYLAVLPLAVNELGTTVTKLLDITETDDARLGSLSDLQMSVGQWVMSAMQVAGVVHLSVMGGQQHMDNMQQVGGKVPEKLKLTDHSKVYFVGFNKDENGNPKRVQQIVQTNKESSGVLNELFGVDIGLRFPKLSKPTKVKRTIKGMKTLVSNLQATFINKMQQEAITLDVPMVDAMSHALSQFGDEFSEIIEASITDDKLNKLHINDRKSAQSKAEGYRRELQNALGFVGNLKRTEQGFQKFYDSIYVAKNNRMHFNSNVFNMQTSLIHRMMASYENFKTDIDVTGVTFDNLVQHALDKDGKPTLLGFYLRALGANLEGTEKFFEAKYKNKYKAYTVDKLKSSFFVPTFVEFLNSKEVQSAINAMTKLQANDKLSKKEIKAIKDFVKTGDMGIQSFRALVELANLKQAMTTGKLTTTIGLGSDGVNNGIAIGSVYNGISDIKTLIQLGFVPKDNEWLIKDYFDSREVNELGDYYEAYANQLKSVIDNTALNEQERAVLDTIVKLQPTIYGRKFAKAIIIPFGYSAGIKRLLQVAQETFVADIQKQLASLANNFDDKKHKELEQSLQVFLGNNFVLPKEPNQLLEFWFNGKELKTIMGAYDSLLGDAIETSLNQFASEFITARSQNVAMHEATFNLFYDAYQAVVTKASNELANELGLSADEFIERGFTKQEWQQRVIDELKVYMPKVKTAFATTQGEVTLDETLEQIDDELETGIEVFARATAFVANRQDTKNKLKNQNNELQSISIKLPAKKALFESAGVFVNSAQIQGTDGRISAEVSSMLDGFVNLNIHDQNDSGLANYLQMVAKQNKVTFDVLATNHIQLNSLETLVEMVGGFVQLFEKQMLSQKQLDYNLAKVAVLVGETENINTVITGLINRVQDIELSKLSTMANLHAVHQYAGELGHHVVSQKDIELLEKQKQVVNNRIAKLQELTKALPVETIPSVVVGFSQENPNFEVITDTTDLSKNDYIYGASYKDVNIATGGIGKFGWLGNNLKGLLEDKRSDITTNQAAKGYIEILTNKVLNNREFAQALINLAKTPKAVYAKKGIANAKVLSFVLGLAHESKTVDVFRNKITDALIKNVSTKQVGKYQIVESLLDKPFTLAQGLDKLLIQADEYSSTLTKRIVGLNPDVHIHIVSDSKTLDKKTQADVQAGGMYYPDSNTIIINPNTDEWGGSFIELVNHELMHAVTADVIGFDDKSTKLTNGQVEQFEKIKDDLNDFRMQNYGALDENTVDRLNYALTKDFPHELVSVYVSEYSVRTALKSVLPNETKQLDNLIKQIVGKKDDQHNQSRIVRTGTNRSNTDVQSDEAITKSSSQGVADTTTKSDTDQGDLSNTQRDLSANEEKQNGQLEQATISANNEVATQNLSINSPKEFIDKLLVNVKDIHPSQKALLDYLLPSLLKANDFTFEWDKDITSHGLYVPNDNVIKLNPAKFKGLTDYGKVGLVLHEVIHATTEYAIAKPTKAQQKAIDTLEQMRKHLLTKAQDEKLLKRLENVNEFIAYGLTDKAFMNFIADNLDTTKIKLANRIANGLNEFFKQVLDLFGWFNDGKTNKDKQQIYKTFVNLSVSLIGDIKNPDTDTTGRASSVNETQDVVADINTQAHVLQGEPVSVIDETKLDMPKQGGFKAIQTWATELFAQQGGKAVNPVIGKVELHEQSVRSSLAHGKLSYHKNLAFAGVKDVLEQGVIIAKDSNGKEDSFYISAPVLIKGERVIQTILVHRDVNTQRMYIHSVMLEKNLLTPRVSEAPSKDGKQNSSSVSKGALTPRVSEAPTIVGKQNGSLMSKGNQSSKHTGMLTSTDIHNILQKALTHKTARASEFDADSIVNDKSAIDVLKQMPTSASEDFNKHLDNLLDKTVGSFYEHNENNKKQVDKTLDKPVADSRVLLFGLDDKQAHVYQVLKTVLAEYVDNHAGTVVVNDMLKIYQESKAQLSYTHFLTNQDNPSELEIKQAKKAYDSIFGSKTGEDYLANFVALSLVAPQLNGLLDKKREYIKRDIQRPLFDRLMRALDTVVNFFTGLYSHKTGRVNEQLVNLTQKLAVIDTYARTTQASRIEMVWQMVGSGIGKLNRPIHWSVMKVMKYLAKSKIRGVETVYNLLHNSYHATKLGSSGSEVYNGLIQEYITKGQRVGELRDLVNEIANNSSITKAVEKLIRYTQNISQTRQKIKTAVRSAMLADFNNKELSEEERADLTSVIMRSDLGGLLSHMNMPSVLTMLTDKAKRDKKIELLEQAVLTHKHGNDMLMQAKSLSAYMVRGVTPKFLVKNVEAIAMGQGLDKVNDIKDMDKRLFNQLDILVSLYALNMQNKETQKRINHLVATEKKGISSLIKYHQEFVKQSKQEFKDNPLNYQKGYTPEILSPFKSLQWVAKDDVEEMLKQGWQLVDENNNSGTLRQDNLDATEARVLLYHDDIGHYQRRVTGAIDPSSTHSKGTVVYGVHDFMDLNRVANEMLKQRQERAKTVNYKNYNPFNETGGLVVNFGADGYIIDYHYEMQGFMRDKYLQRNNDIFDLLPTMASTLAFKKNIVKHRAVVADVLVHDYKANYKKNPALFVMLDPTSTDKKVQEDYLLLPHDLKVRLHEQFGRGKPIYVRASIYNQVFGYRVFSLAKMFDKTFDEKNALEKIFTGLFGSILGDKAQSHIAKAERVVQFIVGLTKDFIVIRSGKVLLGNIMANLLLLGLHGVRPDVMIKDLLFAWREGSKYGKWQARVLEIDTLLLNAKAEERKALNQEKHELLANMAKSPMKAYMNAGMMSTIVEDTVVFKDKPDYLSVWEERVQKHTDKIPDEIKTAFNWLTISPDTPIYQFLAEATQFSDFGAKYVLAKHLQGKGVSFDKSLSEAQENFINFDVPTGRGLDYLNRVGLFMFTKFFLRFQKVMYKMFVNKTAQSVSQHLFVEHGLDMAGFYDPAMMLRIGNNPFEASAFSFMGASDELMTYQMLEGVW